MAKEFARCTSPSVNPDKQKATAQCYGSPIMTKHYAHFSNEAKSAILQALPCETTNATDGQNGQAPEARDELLKMLAGMDPQKVQELLELAQQKELPKRPSRKTTPKPDEGN